MTRPSQTEDDDGARGTSVEACGRCSLSTVVDAAAVGREVDAPDRDPYGDARIEVDEREFSLVSPGFWFARLSSRLDAVGRRLTWGR
ncbi:hypothetical protein [Natrononativus amylolyticus]|uniref:hypothetical protein n=1 Tax=Natrononativus amylolyticus TaxID=2963434 RepID=UPI0020CBE168|nr:hypothetical protein [Natrononativus amylolyticus]